MLVKVKKLNENAVIPTYGTEYSAGADLYACTEEDITINSGETKLIKTDKTSETIKLEMKHVETNGDFSRYNLVEDTSLKTESKHSNVSMLLHTNKQQVLECRYIISK